MKTDYTYNLQRDADDYGRTGYAHRVIKTESSGQTEIQKIQQRLLDHKPAVYWREQYDLSQYEKEDIKKQSKEKDKRIQELEEGIKQKLINFWHYSTNQELRCYSDIEGTVTEFLNTYNDKYAR